VLEGRGQAWRNGEGAISGTVRRSPSHWPPSFCCDRVRDNLKMCGFACLPPVRVLLEEAGPGVADKAAMASCWWLGHGGAAGLNAPERRDCVHQVLGHSGSG
jgi:hypothetical protein